jgi:hypothetical protein
VRAGSASSPESGPGNGASLTGVVREFASSQLLNQKRRATDGLGQVASAVRTITDQLRSQGHTTIAGYVQNAATRIERFSNGLRDRDLDQIARDVRQFARRQPALFVGSAFGVGLLSARFFKSSNGRRRTASDETRAVSSGAEAFEADTLRARQYRSTAIDRTTGGLRDQVLDRPAGDTGSTDITR